MCVEDKWHFAIYGFKMGFGYPIYFNNLVDINAHEQRIDNSPTSPTDGIVFFPSKLYSQWICSFIHVSKQRCCVLFQRNLMSLLRNSWCNPIQVHYKNRKLIKVAKNNLCVSLETLLPDVWSSSGRQPATHFTDKLSLALQTRWN